MIPPFQNSGIFYSNILNYSKFSLLLRMKYFLFTSLISLFITFNSCNSTDDTITTNSTKKIVLSKVTTMYYEPLLSPSANTNVQTFEYNSQGELIKIKSNERTSFFEYNNGKPVKVIHYDANQKQDYYIDINYDGDILLDKETKYTSPYTSPEIYKYTYNSNDQIASFTVCSYKNCPDPYSYTYAYNENNISSETISQMVYNKKEEFSYDNKLNPYTNTNKYLKIIMGEVDVLSKNNSTTRKISYKNNSGNWVENQVITYSTLYNDSHLPIQRIGKEANGTNYVKFDYEYITL